MTGNEIREMFLRYFEGQDHRRVRSSSLVPIGDPTLLFTNAGMNQFKDVFLGLEQRDYKRATSCQKCVRAGGKHNDLENVGFTKRHHTFFEMLGNFSFGDYFKEKAIPYAWELVTSPKSFGIPKDKLYFTVFGGAEVGPNQVLGSDRESMVYWTNVGAPKDRIISIPGLKDNFWAMGDTGPCGPCSEIHYDMGPEASDLGHGISAPACTFPCDCGRFVEIWNLVFMQFNRYCEAEAAGFATDNERRNHRHGPECLSLTLLPRPSVDTGMGLERIAAVLQGVISNYDTDLFVPLMRRAAELLNVRQESNPNVGPSLRIIADHARATTFLISDGVLPSNDGRGYVLRKIMRRAIRHGHMWGSREPFFFKMVDAVRDVTKDAYPELVDSARNVARVVEAEERQFARTIEIASGKLEKIIENVKSAERDARIREFAQANGVPFDSDLSNTYGGYLMPGNSREDQKKAAEALVGPNLGPALVKDFAQKYKPFLSGSTVFPLYDTYGLPLDFVADTARDLGVHFDMPSFDAAMEEQRKRARASWKGGAKEAANPAYAKLAERFKTEPDFYKATNARDSRIEAIVTKRGLVNELKPGEEGEIVLDHTVIYAESGGQVADTGAFYDNSESQVLADVTGAYYPVAGLIAHKIIAKETLRVGDRVAVVADADRREHIMRNHTGTHLVHAALRNILGTHVKQSGSLNAPDRLRFDFSHFAQVEPEELRDIEDQVNDQIRQNAQIETSVTSLEDALNSGALAFFGDRYPEHNVRVVTIPDPRSPIGFYSKELCGGTHVRRAGDIGVLKIVSERSIAAGVRRVEALTGTGALEQYQRAAQLLTQVASQLNVGEEAVLAQVEKLAQTAKQLEKELETQRRKGALSQFDDLDSLIRASREQVAKEALIKGNSQVRLVKNVKLAVSQVENVDRKALREAVDRLRQEIRSGVVVLASVENGDIALIAGVTKDLTAKVHAGKLIGALAEKLGGKGGGRPDLAEAGGKDTSALKSALQALPSLIERLL